jgi:hypothetical protein
MAKFKITVTFSNTVTPDFIREHYSDLLDLGADDDPVDKLVEYLDDAGNDTMDIIDSWVQSATMERVK